MPSKRNNVSLCLFTLVIKVSKCCGPSHVIASRKRLLIFSQTARHTMARAAPMNSTAARGTLVDCSASAASAAGLRVVILSFSRGIVTHNMIQNDTQRNEAAARPSADCEPGTLQLARLARFALSLHGKPESLLWIPQQGGT